VDKQQIPQQIIFQLMEASSFNEFDGKNVVKSLKEHPELWHSVMFCRSPKVWPLLPLRDLEEGFFNADTVYIYVNGERSVVEEMVSAWGADEIDWLSDEERFDFTTMYSGDVLRVWWD
jgi:hypothetical protein